MPRKRKEKAALPQINDVKLDKISVFFKRSILAKILQILLMPEAGYRTFKSVKNINRLFNNLDLSKYQNNGELMAYIWCIRFVSKQWLSGVVSPEVIVEMAKASPEYTSTAGDLMTKAMNATPVTTPEAKALFDLVSEALQYGYVSSMKDEYINLLDDIDMDEPGAFKKLVERLFSISQSLIDIKHSTNMLANKIEFNTADPDSVKEAISETIQSLQASNNIFKIGIRRLNTLLSPGFMNGRLYTFLGLPGAGKSQPDNTMIPTPSGFVRLDKLKVGDYVFNLYGRPVKVTGVYPQGVKPCYRVDFTDGRYAYCSPDHLWTVIIDGEYVVKPLKDLIGGEWQIPYNGIAQFNTYPVGMDPYLAGYQTGSESGFRNTRIEPCYIINNEFIRRSFIEGLIGSSCVVKHGQKIRMWTTSEMLVSDMKNLLWSLGSNCTVDRNGQSFYINFQWPLKRDRDIKIKMISRVDDCPQRCIRVADRKRMYLTEQFIPTHNSIMLLKCALDIRKYNPDHQPRTPGMKPAVLYITMENTFTETIERVWNLEFDEPMTNYSEAEAIEKICDVLGIGQTTEEPETVGGELDALMTDRKPVKNIEVVIQYYPYRSINTDDLFTIISDLHDENLEVCVLILDYIKRIEPAVPIQDNVRLELDRVMNELKSLAAICNIPVITAHQMNRAAAITVDAATRQGKSDVSKLVGRENVGDSWAVIESSDFAAVLNSEYKSGTDEKYMTINVIKRRRIDPAEAEFAKFSYLAHPFAKNNGLRLIDDMNLDKVLSLQSLGSDIDSMGISKEKVNAVKRLNVLDQYDFDDE